MRKTKTSLNPSPSQNELLSARNNKETRGWKQPNYHETKISQKHYHTIGHNMDKILNSMQLFSRADHCGVITFQPDNQKQKKNNVFL